MSKHQAMVDAIQAYQPDGADAPVLYASMEVNGKGFRALLGRKLKPLPMTIATWISVFIILAFSVVSTIAFMQSGTATFAAYIPLFVVLYFYRTTLVAVGDEGICFYFAQAKRGPTYHVYDNISLPYDSITNVKVRAGRFNTGFTFEFSVEGKRHKIKASVPNKMKKAGEQAENLIRLREALGKYHNG